MRGFRKDSESKGQKQHKRKPEMKDFKWMKTTVSGASDLCGGK